MFSKCNHSVFTVFQLHDIWKRAALSRPCLHVSCVCISPPMTISLTPPFIPSFLLSDHHFLHYSSPDLFSQSLSPPHSFLPFFCLTTTFFITPAQTCSKIGGKNGLVYIENICNKSKVLYLEK